MEIEFRVTEKRWIHLFLQCKSMGKKNSALKGEKTPKWIIQPGPNSNSFQAFMPVLVTEIIFFTAQGHVTPNWLVRSSRNLNPSNTWCPSLLPVSLMKIEFIISEKKWIHHFLWEKNFRAQGRITPKWIIRSSPNLNSFELLCLSSLPASLAKIQSKVTEKRRRHFFTAQGHITLKWLVRYDRNSNSSEILCLSSLPVSLMKTEFIVTEKRWRHLFPMQSQWECSKANNS